MREVLLRLVAILEQQQQRSYEEVDDEDNGNDRRICLFEMQITLHRRAARRLGRTPGKSPARAVQAPSYSASIGEAAASAAGQILAVSTERSCCSLE